MDPETPLWRALKARLEQHPDRPALRFGDLLYTYAELGAGIERSARALAEAGVSQATHVGLMMANCPEFICVWLAAARLGACLVPLNTRLKGEILAYQIEHAAVDVLVADSIHKAVVEQVSPRVPLLDPPPRVGEGWGRGLINLTPNPFPRRERKPSAPPTVAEGLGAESGPALIIYTSGTTGRPKGVAIGRQAQLKHGMHYRELLGLEDEETAYVYLPLYHVTAMGSTLGTLLSGGSVALENGFNPFGFWARTRRYDARVFTFVGSVIAMLHSRPQRKDDAVNPVRRAVGAATPARLWRSFEQRFGVDIVETYGQTEMASLWLMPPPEGARVGTVGKPPAGRFEARVVDERRMSLPPGTRGELAIRPADPGDMMQGYYGDQSASQAAMPGDGWYYSGDLAIRDADGYFRYAGRLKDCIRRRGENISAFEIEQVVNAHPAVLESAAVGVPAASGEEELKLCVVPRPAMSLQPPELLSFCRDRLPDFMVPRYIELRQSLPRTATERVCKADLAAEGIANCWQARGRPRSPGTAL